MLVVVWLAQGFSTIESKGSRLWTENLGLAACLAKAWCLSRLKLDIASFSSTILITLNPVCFAGIFTGV